MLPSLSRFLCIFAVLSGLLSGCTTTPVTPDHIEAPPDEIASVLDQGLVPVARYGRYTLIELVPQPAQRDLLRQAVEITIPPTLDATVGDAMRHVLLRSGYRLCDGTEAAALYALPLPAAHLHLGPLLLRDALLVLAGPAWALSVDDRTREVCFNRSADAAEVQS
ncbi:PilL N-terminal domain-containing protein [Ottowia sp.]|uniref:PFGI-1 class ICE element type IV pilus protein PilL2 n=1 Tax=Ottowia sp. TaxID=1898956 RepID=UPI002620D9C3|nr:PilL N-terminal domain-containing protein [Ottowia sp.]